MKKLLAVLVCAAMLLSMLLPAFAEEEKKWELGYTTVERLERGDDVIARFVVGSDVHIGYGYSSQKLNNAYDVIGKMGGVDAFIIAGDVTERGDVDQYEELMRIVNDNTAKLTVDIDGYGGRGAGEGAPADTTILVLGNHEFYDIGGSAPGFVKERFKEQTGQEIDKLYWLEGKVPVIKLGMDEADAKNSYASKYEFLKKSFEEIDNSGWKGHIFLISHVDLQSYSSTPKETLELLAKYPQLVNVSGHTHMNPYSPYFIDQSHGYTTMNDGVVGKDFGGDSAHGSTGIIFDVKENGETQFYRVDFHNGRIMFPDENWVLRSSDTPEDFIYVDDGRENSYYKMASAPYYESDAEVTMRDLGNNDSIEVTFSKAKTETNCNYNYISRYYVEAFPADGEGTVRKTTLVNPDHIPGNFESDKLSVVIHGVDWNEDYKVKVTAQTVYGLKSGFIESKGTVNVGERDLKDEIALLYDIDYSDGDGKDKMGHESKVEPFIKIKQDDAIAKQAANFIGLGSNSYAFGEDDIEAIREEFTIEAYVYLADTEEKQEIIGNIETASISLGVSDGKVYLITYTGNETTDTTCEADVEAGRWVHIAVTYDFKDARMYIDGKLADTTRMPGGLLADVSRVAEELRYFNIGGRDKSGEFSYSLKVGNKVNTVKIYGGAMSPEQVADAFIETIGIPFTDVKDTAWFSPSVKYAYLNGLMNGTSATRFSPKDVTTRAMLVRMLYNLEGMPKVDYKDVFTDVKKGSWYANAVMWAYENGVTTGTSDTTFSPETPVTREQVAVFLYRYMKNYKKADMMEGRTFPTTPT